MEKTPVKLDRITINPARMNGQPCIRDLRLTVRRVIELLATYPNREELYREFPELEDEDIRQSLIYASMCLDDRIIECEEDLEQGAAVTIDSNRIRIRRLPLKSNI